MPTASGSDVNVPAAYRAGFKRARVYGTFTPAVDTFRGCELQNGASINLTNEEARGAFAAADETGIRVARFGTILYIR